MSASILAGKQRTRRGVLPALSMPGEVALDHYEQALRWARLVRHDHDLYSSNEERSAKGSREDRLGVKGLSLFDHVDRKSENKRLIRQLAEEE